MVEFDNVNVFLLNTKLIVTFSWPIERKVRFFGCGNIWNVPKSIHFFKKVCEKIVQILF